MQTPDALEVAVASVPSKGTLMGAPVKEPQEYIRNIIGIDLPGSLCSILFLLYSWGSLFGLPIKVPFKIQRGKRLIIKSSTPEVPRHALSTNG